jgi:hypothetical protein
MGERIGAYRVLVRRPDGNRPLEDLVQDGTIILKWIFRNWDGSMDWIAVPQDRSKWRAVMNAVTNLRVPKNTENILIS